MRDDDAALVLAAREGDREACAALIGRRRPLLLALCRRMLGDKACGTLRRRLSGEYHTAKEEGEDMSATTTTMESGPIGQLVLGSPVDALSKGEGQDDGQDDTVGRGDKDRPRVDAPAVEDGRQQQAHDEGDDEDDPDAAPVPRPWKRHAYSPLSLPQCTARPSFIPATSQGL